MDNVALYGLTAVPAILGAVQVAKQAGLSSRYAPLLALALGLIAGSGQALVNHLDWPSALAAGTALGLSASGLYSGSKAVTTKTGETTTTDPQEPAPLPDPILPVPPRPRPRPVRSSTGKFAPKSGSVPPPTPPTTT